MQPFVYLKKLEEQEKIYDENNKGNGEDEYANHSPNPKYLSY